MELKYDMSQNYKALYNEANGVFACKKKLLKNENHKIRTFLTGNAILFAEVEILSIAAFILCCYLEMEISAAAALFIMFTGVFYIVFCIVAFNKSMRSKINSKTGILEINSDGISDKSDNGNHIMFSYDNIELIVITKKTIVFLTDGPLMFFIPNEDKEKIKAQLREYSDVKIIDKA